MPLSCWNDALAYSITNPLSRQTLGFCLVSSSTPKPMFIGLPSWHFLLINDPSLRMHDGSDTRNGRAAGRRCVRGPAFAFLRVHHWTCKSIGGETGMTPKELGMSLPIPLLEKNQDSQAQLGSWTAIRHGRAHSVSEKPRLKSLEITSRLAIPPTPR
jgi:hypothetical protein